MIARLLFPSVSQEQQESRQECLIFFFFFNHVHTIVFPCREDEHKKSWQKRYKRKSNTACTFYRFPLSLRRAVGELVSWCFEPSQPLGIISGLKKKKNNHQKQTNKKPPIHLSVILHESHLKPTTILLQHS